MKSRILTCMIVFTSLAVPGGPAAQEQQQQNTDKPQRYAITDLGTLGGTFSAASGVNNEGDVVGASTLLGDTVVRVFLWRRGVMSDLGTLGGLNSIDLGLNPISNRGAVVGSSNTATPDPNGEDFCFDPASNICLPFVWRHGVMTPLPLFGGVNGAAFQSNNRGQIVGAAENQIHDPTCAPPQVLQLRAALWEKGQIRELPPFPGDPDAFAGAINDKGQIVGGSGPCTITMGNIFHALLWENDTLIDLGNLGGSTGNGANQINNREQVVGQSGTPDGFVHAFLWKNGVMTDLGTLPGLPISQALGINEKGQIVGFAQDATGDESSSVALLWQDGKLIDLNTLISADSPWFLQEAFSINDRGQIAGHMFNRETNEVHAFVATPLEGGESSALAVRENYERPNATLSEDVVHLLQQRGRFGRFMPFSRASVATTLAPIASLSPTSLTFATQAIGTTSGAKTVVLKNTGTATLTITSIAIVGTNATDFAQTHTCGNSLAAAASCSISISFKPKASGTRTADLSISDNAGGSPQKVSVTGVGTTAKLSPTSINFGSIAIGNSSFQTVTLTNVGTTTLTISGVTIGGADAGDFIWTNYCSSALAASASCIIDVTFKPTAAGTRTAALSVADSAAGSPQHVVLSGKGVTGRCSQRGMECAPQFPPCCPGLVCRPASTRFFCEPAASQNVRTDEVYENGDKAPDRTPVLKDRLADSSQ